MWENFLFTDDFQECIIACFVRHPSEFTDFGHIVEPEFFSGLATYKLVYYLKEFREKYDAWPSAFTVLANYAKDRLRYEASTGHDDGEEVLALCRRLATIN